MAASTEIIGAFGRDLELFETLGIKKFNGNLREIFFVADVPRENYPLANIQIWASNIPQQHWIFKITDEDGKTFKLKTGPGPMCDYWETAVMFAEGWLSIDKH